MKCMDSAHRGEKDAVVSAQFSCYKEPLQKEKPWWWNSSKQQHSILRELSPQNNKKETTITVPGSHGETVRSLNSAIASDPVHRHLCGSEKHKLPASSREESTPDLLLSNSLHQGRRYSLAVYRRWLRNVSAHNSTPTCPPLTLLWFAFSSSVQFMISQ